MGIINAGTAVGAVAAPPLIVLILMHAHWFEITSWRWVFFITGGFGLAWALAWSFIYFTPPSTDERTGAEPTTPAISVGMLVAKKEVRGIVIAKFLSDAAWYFYLFWLPKYLYDARGFDVKAVGTFAWIPPVAAGVGCLCGGGASSWLLQRGVSVNRARKIVLGASAFIMPFVLFVPAVPVNWAIALFSLAYFGHQSWSTLVMILPTDLFPRKVVGAVAGLVGCAGALGGVVFGQAVGYLLDHGFGWGIVFAVAGSFHVVGFLVICWAIPTIRPCAIANSQ